MPLSSDLSGQKAALASALPPEVFARIGRSISDLEATGIGDRAAAVGASIAWPVLESPDGVTLDLGAVVRGRPAILVFYRGGWCPYCNVTLRAYAKLYAQIEAAGGVLVAVTPEDQVHASATIKDGDLPFAVAVDRGNRFARSLGLAFGVPDDLRPVYRDIGIDLPARNGDDSHELPIPATYVADSAGRVAWAHVDADFTTRGEPTEALAALRLLADGAARAGH